MKYLISTVIVAILCAALVTIVTRCAAETNKVTLQSTNVAPLVKPADPKPDPEFNAYLNGVRIGFNIARRNQDISEQDAINFGHRLWPKK